MGVKTLLIDEASSSELRELYDIGHKLRRQTETKVGGSDVHKGLKTFTEQAEGKLQACTIRLILRLIDDVRLNSIQSLQCNASMYYKLNL